MADTKKTTKTKTAANKAEKTETPEKIEAKKADDRAEIKATEKAISEDTKPAKTDSNGSGKTLAIIILASVLVFMAIVFTVLFATGVIKVGSNDGQVAEKTDFDDDDSDDNNRGSHRRKHNDDDTEKGDIIDNPNPQVKEDNATLVRVGELEFYLPRQFEYGGKNKDGAMTYNLEDDDGWASVSVYSERSSLSPAAYLNKVSSYLEVTDNDYQMNGTTWVQAETASTLAYATKLDDKVYAVYYAVKLDSDATAKAMQMIPKTLYMKKIVKE